MLKDFHVLNISEIKHRNGCGEVGNEPQIKFSKLHGGNVCSHKRLPLIFNACICFLLSVPEMEINVGYILGTCKPVCPLLEDSFAYCGYLLFRYNCNCGKLS